MRRDGEESRAYLIECFETYVTRHTLEGFEAKGADQELDIIRRSVDTGSRTIADLDGCGWPQKLLQGLRYRKTYPGECRGFNSGCEVPSCGCRCRNRLQGLH